MDRKQLNEYQLRAVLDESDACLVSACVGSGKTTVLVEKLRYLHEEKGIPYDRMIVFTFTNKAAREMTGRLLTYAEAVGEPLTKEDLHWFGTFHSVAVTILRELLPEDGTGYRRDFTVITPEEELELADEIIRRDGLKIKYRNRLAKRLEKKGREKIADDLPVLREKLAEEKAAGNRMNFDELITETVRVLGENREGLLGEGFPDWIVIDEVQDTDEAQYAMIRALKKPGTKLFAVGDPNQVIYSWRGSVFQVFFRMKQEFHAEEISLPVNYRSSNVILAAAGRFLESGTQIIGTRHNGDKLVVRECLDAFQDAGEISDLILGMHAEGVPYREIAVFYRLQEQADCYRSVFTRSGIPCRVVERKSTPELLVWEDPANRTESDGGQDSPEPEEDCVNLMTLHASKGLEFSHVFIVGVNNGLIPLGSGGYDEEEEERRLFFVGMTRAKDTLNLSCYRNPGRARVMPGPGRFLKMLPAEYTEGMGRDDRRADIQILRRQMRESMQGSGWSSPFEMFAEDTEKQGRKDGENPDKTGHSDPAEALSTTESGGRSVRHPRYGIGQVVREDTDNITVDFPGFGEKDFLKIFSELEDL